MTVDTPPGDPLEALDALYAWYRRRAVRAGKLYKTLEVALLVFAALVPVSAVVTASWVTALLGAVVVVLTGLRSIFSWQDDWLRFTEAWQQLAFARALYVNGMPPYADPATRTATLVARVQEVQAAETRGWLALRAEAKNKTPDRHRAEGTVPPAPPGTTTP